MAMVDNHNIAMPAFSEKEQTAIHNSGLPENLGGWPNKAGFQTNYEQPTPVELPITGSIPAYASGTLYRTGPASYEIQDTKNGSFSLSHWFDGFAQIYRFQIIAEDNGQTKVLYNSRRQVDKLIENIKKKGKLDYITFGQKSDPCIGVFGKVMSVFQAATQPILKDPLIVNISVTLRANLPGLAAERKDPKEQNGGTKVPKTMHVLSDVTKMKEIDPTTLEPLEMSDQSKLHPSLGGPLSSAHGMTDPETGDAFNYNLSFGRKSTYRVFRTSASTGKTDILASFNATPAYIHSFFLTRDYLILAIWTSHIGGHGLKVVAENNVLDAITPFDSSQPTKWYVIDRKQGHGVVAIFESPASFCFHSINAWQETDSSGNLNIICDYVEYENLDILHNLYYSNMVSTDKEKVTFNSQQGITSIPTLSRVKLSNIQSKPLPTSLFTKKPTTAERILTIPKGHIGDLPTINPNFEHKPNRYIYSIVNRGYSTFLDGISKVDTVTKEVIYWDNQRGHTPGEAIFVPRPDGTEEDDGVLLSVVLDGFKETSYLLCLDARTMKELGKAECGCAVGLGFHGLHLK